MLASDVDAYRVIDTDTHVIEPYDLWTSRLDVGKWGDKVPHVRFDEKSVRKSLYPLTQASINSGSPRASTFPAPKPATFG